jgi:peptide deformylase
MYPILTFPDPRLRNVAQPVDQVDGQIIEILDKMLATMYEAPGIGLAATQVNIPRRLVVIDLSEEQNQPLYLINPVILEREGETVTDEGCLSVPGFFEPVKRASELHVQALNREGEMVQFEANDLLAVCIQHELDHLDGKLFVDHISSLKRSRIREKLLKQERAARASTRASKGDLQ